MPDFVSVCEQAARAGGEVLLDLWGNVRPREKGPKDLVTEADEASQEAIRACVLGRFPDHGFLGEEGADLAGADARYRWIVDPLDGTVNYVHRVPNFSVSVALECQAEVVAGAVFNPVSGESYTAARGEGAFLDGRRLAVSRTCSIAAAMVAASFPPRLDRDSPEIARFVNVLLASQTVLRTGSAALNLAYVAAGRYDAYWATSVKSWDVAAGLLLVEEAGGVTTNLSGGPINLDRPRFAAAATPQLHQQLLEHLAEPRIG